MDQVNTDQKFRGSEMWWGDGGVLQVLAQLSAGEILLDE
jgi:hypothetical protein